MLILFFFFILNILKHYKFSNSAFCLLSHTACPYKPIDLIFALDGSGSEGSRNFQKQLEFVKNFTSQFEIGPNHTRVSLLTFATNVHNEFYLNELHDNVTVMESISNTTYPDGETNTHKGNVM